MTAGSLNEPIAIIGIGCRFSGGATDPDKFWELLRNSRSTWSEIPTSRFNADGAYHPDPEKKGTSNVMGGHFLSQDIGAFDASFFNFSSEFAATLDPQYRMELEVVYEALESAGVPLSAVKGSNTSVYAGACFRDYHDSLIRDPDTLPRSFMTGNGVAMASNRVSHFYDLRGPSISIDTGCSTTLTALHLAVQGLRSFESDLAVVSGASLNINPDMYITLSNLGVLSPDGLSYSFDDRANGYGRGEGVAAIIVKRLEDAVKDGDPIRAIIRETGLNQDGKTTTITSPSQLAQQELIQMCYHKAGLDPYETAFIEAHGTGTATGDPIEAGAIAEVFCKSRTPENKMFMGSVKSNIGHTEATSGLASIIKIVLAFEKNVIPPNVHFKEKNPKLRFEDWNLKIPLTLQPWPSTNGVRRASVNNFGYGGANAHVILEANDFLPTINSLDNGLKMRLPSAVNGLNSRHNLNGIDSRNGNETRDEPISRIFLLSAKDQNACETMAARLKDYVLNHHSIDETNFLDNLAYTLGSRRSVFNWAAAYPASTSSALANALISNRFKPTRSSDSTRIGFVFTGQGAQWYAMGRELINAYPVFKTVILQADACIKKLGSHWSILEELQRDPENSRVNEISFSLPLCTAIQLALVELLRSWGITPTAVTGHSSGEIAAAYAAGALSLESAIAIPYLRGQLILNSDANIVGKGGMLAVGLGREAAESYISRLNAGMAVVACVNSQLSVTVSGDVAALSQLEEMLLADKVFARRVKVNTAFHSPQMEPMSKAYSGILARELRQGHGFGGVIFSSSTTATRLNSPEQLASPEHWVLNMLQAVEFEKSFHNMCFNESSKQDVDIVVEVGPHGALGGPVKQLLSLPAFEGRGISYFSCLLRGKNADETIHDLACDLLRRGLPVNMDAVNFPHGRGEVQALHDLPPYPWNHQIRHWIEPRVNNALRYRPHRHHDLLGSLQPGSNTLTPTWKHIIRTSDLPWVREHVVQSQFVYPGAGFLCMAIEGINQIHENDTNHVAGYQLRDVEISKALVIPDNEDGAEVQMTILPSNDRVLGDRDWQEFHIYSVTSQNQWTEHCKGHIKVDHDLLDGKPRTQLNGSGLAKLSKAGNATDYRTKVDPNDIFKSLRDTGIFHGTPFQNIHAIQVNGRAQAEVIFSITDTTPSMPMNYQHEHIIHPTTLDSVFLAAYSALSGSDKVLRSGFVPRSIKRLRISRGISNVAGHHFKANSAIHHLDSLTFLAGVSVSNDCDASGAILELEGLSCRSLGLGSNQNTDSHQQEICSAMTWDLDVSFRKLQILKEGLEFPFDEVEAAAMMDLRRACLHYMREATTLLTAHDVERLEPHLKKFYAWMNMQLDAEEKSSMKIKSSGIEDLLRTVSTANVNGQMVTRLGSSLIPVLKGEVTTLELMRGDNLLTKYYIDALKWDRSIWQASQLVKLCAHKFPQAKILEIGAGTGGATQAILDGMGGAPFGHYEFTDISPGFFEAAKDRFSSWENIMNFRKLDIEFDPIDQGFEAGTYDVVIAAQVLHATKNMENTMANVRKLLKPGGKLILLETTQDQMDVFFAFGLLPGWWLSDEKEREFTPSLSKDHWSQVLKKSGFNGVELEVSDCENEEFYMMSTMMSTASQPLPRYSSSFTLVYSTTCPPGYWLEDAKNAISAITGSVPSVEKLEDVIAAGKVIIFLDIADNILRDINSDQFKTITSLLADSKGLLWVSSGGAMDCEQPDASLQIGFLRTMRNESGGRQYVSLDLDPNQQPWSVDNVFTICEILRATFDDTCQQAVRDFEYAERHGAIYTPRIYKENSLNKFVDTHRNETDVHMEPFYQPNSPLRMAIGTPGLLDTLYFHEDPNVDKDLDPEQIEIDSKAIGINFRDVMVAMGQLEANAFMGFECSGTIARLGAKAASQGFKVGDRVCSILRGHWATLPRTSWKYTALIPDEMSHPTAAAIPLVFTTAYVSLYETARLQKGEKVLVHAASGGVGQAAIIFSKLVGAEIFVTVGSNAKRQLIADTYGIPNDHIFSSRDISFAEQILAMTNGKGVDVILNSLAGSLLQESFNCLCDFGRFVEIGKRDLEQNSSLDMLPFTRNVSFSSVDLMKWAVHKPDDVFRVLNATIELLRQNTINPMSPITTYPITDIEKAFRTMQAGNHVGKIVITISQEDMVPVKRSSPIVKFAPNSSYLIVGGMGGIGRSLCQWMVEHGAKHLVIMSRKAEKSPFLAELEETGCNIRCISCDVSSSSELSRAMQNCAGMPPVKGVIQGAMVLKDSVIETMSLADFNTAVLPKVQGSWNLHQQLPNLDFFIMLSSLSGILGNKGQANYASGGAFQDALCQYRQARGLPAVTIDLGQVKGVGYVAESQNIGNTLERIGMRPVSEKELHRIIEACIVSPSPAQIITGINTGPGPHWEDQVWAKDARFAPLKYSDSSAQQGRTRDSSTGNILDTLSTLSTLEEVADVVLQALVKKLSNMFMVSKESITPSQQLDDLGVDSLVAVELKNWLASHAAANVSIFELLNSSSLKELSTTIASRSTRVDPSLLS
ncbi:uncharacterized protein BP5553_09895 [Venustampulla echinocandica]|uniref:Uncharacterized protein n=1 Tax=Venustampulla echinocandica TaxID=2656787 RepID=A0A370TAZ9_9HELO|nr:uncharacterized protein BP5553_09895 [Venustampulla echinocandica]RDL31106.1 hypothetical protein BP5553_09895 [Venustampulla echinocandica]